MTRSLPGRAAPWAFLLIALAVVSLICVPAYAQVLYGSIVGTVGDPTGAVVPGAEVKVTNNATGLSRETTTDAQGRFSMPSLLPGSYDITVTSTGFSSLTREGVDVTINTVSRVDLRLQVGQVSEQVTVSGTALALQTEKSDVNTEISSQEMTSVPLPGYRNYQTLMNLVPGATPAAFQNAVVDTPGRALTTNINGTARNNNNTLTDGAVNINIWLPHHTAYVQPIESIETVNISTNSFDAEQGMAGGAAITVVTKSGTNDLHGVAFWFHNNNRLNTAPYFRSATYKLPKTTLNIAGGTLGGPIIKNKLFYFFSYERTMEGTGYSGNYSVAPAAFRNGDFSAWNSYAKVYDPLTAAQDQPDLRTQFAGNIIPSSRISPIAGKIYNGIPLPNQISPTDPNNLAGNYGASGVLSLTRNQYDFKPNWVVNDKLSLWGKYSRMDAPVSGKYVFGDKGGPALGTDGKGDTTTQLATVGYNVTVSPTFLMDGVFGYTRMDQTVSIPGQGKNVGLDDWGVPGTNGGVRYANDPRYGGLPNVSGFGFNNVGVAATWTPLFRKERSFTFQANFSKLAGAHEIRFGFEPRRLILDHWQPETANPRGEIVFSGDTTNISTQTAREPNAFAAFLLGLPASYNKSVQYMLMTNREWQTAYYIRDRWQVNQNLTVNLGLRYEYYPLISRKDRGIERWDPYTNTVYLGGVGSVPHDANITVSKKLFAPRVGIAYRFAGETVIRAGYGITYDPVPFSRPLRGLYPSTITGQFPRLTPFGWYNNLAQGIPEIPVPDISTGILQLPLNIDMGPRSPWGGPLKRGYIQSWNLTLERRLPWGILGSAGYVATRTIAQMMDRNINTIGPGLGGNLNNLPLAQLYGRRIGANMWNGWGYAAYDSLQAKADKQFGSGLFFTMSYTFSKALNMADDTGWAGPKAFNWDGMLARNYSYAGYDRTHMFTSAFAYDLPFGEGRHVNLTGPANQIFGGWKLSGTFYAYTGTPFTVTGTNSTLLCAGCNQTAFQLGPVKKLDKKGPQQPYFEPSSFRDPLFYFDKNNPKYVPGSMGWNALHGPGFWQLNPGLFKTFRLTEKLNMEFRAEANNVMHNTRWSNPSGSSANMRLKPDGSLDTSVANPLNGFMTITGADSFRQFRFGLRLSF
ncbi:MAG: carboxypeptidase regulatory-like domain-containing protein [Bryobacterales bacterium]|nr:carboxypeptidase regulatory-like domain-containing protein [Bryobacterales bacterium]